MKAYLDSSFLSSLYIKDSHHVAAISTITGTRSSLLISSLSELEVTNAIELGVFRSTMRRSEGDQAHAAFHQDIENGTFQVFDLDLATFLSTKKLIIQHTQFVGCRTADILHVAAALACGADTIFTFDIRQRELARRVKLQTN